MLHLAAAMRRLVGAIGASLLTALTAASAAGAAESGDYYAGKTLTMIAGLPPGGGVDG